MYKLRILRMLTSLTIQYLKNKYNTQTFYVFTHLKFYRVFLKINNLKAKIK